MNKRNPGRLGRKNDEAVALAFFNHEMAKRYTRQLVELMKKTFGADHPNTRTTITNLELIVQHQKTAYLTSDAQTSFMRALLLILSESVHHQIQHNQSAIYEIGIFSLFNVTSHLIKLLLMLVQHACLPAAHCN
jgi:hypothetical protein